MSSTTDERERHYVPADAVDSPECLVCGADLRAIGDEALRGEHVRRCLDRKRRNSDAAGFNHVKCMICAADITALATK